MIKTILSILLLCAFACESYATEIFSTRVQAALRGALNDSGKWVSIDFADGTSQTTAAVSGVASTREINTTLPLSGGGDLSADRTLSIVSSPEFTGNPSIASTYAANRALNGEFTTDLTNWSGANWSWDASGKVIHSAGSTTPLTQAGTVGVVGQMEKITFTLGGTMGSTVTVGIGGQTSVSFSTTGTKTVYLTSTTTGALMFTPATGFTGTIDDVTVEAQTDGMLTVDGGITVNNGQVILQKGSSVYPSVASDISPTTGIYFTTSPSIRASVSGTPIFEIDASSFSYYSTTLQFGSSSPDIVLRRNSANFLEMRNGPSNQIFGIDETWTDASNYNRLKMSATSAGYNFEADQAGTGIAARPFNFNNSLVQSSGNETACIIKGTTNKAAGDDTILKVVQVDTASPGTSNLQEWYSGANGTTRVAYVNNSGMFVANGALFCATVYTTSSGISAQGSTYTLQVQRNDMSTPDLFGVELCTGTLSQTSGSNGALKIKPTYNQVASTASNTDLMINRTETSVGTGVQRLVSFSVDNVEKAGIDNKGKSLWGTVGDSTGSPGNATLNTVSGKSAIAASASAATITNSNVTASSLVFVTPLDLDATATSFKAVSAAGSFTVTVNANATANWKFQWWIIN